TDRERLRLILWAAGVLAATAFASCLPTGSAWPLPTGLGGVVGDALLRLPAWLFGAPLHGSVRIGLALFVGVVTLVALVIAMGFDWRRERARAEEPEEEVADDDRPSVSLGWLYHGLLSVTARLGRMFAGRTPTPRHVAPATAPEEEFVEAESESEEDEGAEEEDEERPARKRARAAKPARRGRDSFELPSLGLLAAPKSSDRHTLSVEAIQENATALEGVLGDFGVRGEIINARPGPVVTLYELEPAPGIKSSRVIGLADDIARSMSALSARVAVVPGRNAIGIELPNPRRERVYFRELLDSDDYTGTSAKLALCLGK